MTHIPISLPKASLAITLLALATAPDLRGQQVLATVPGQIEGEARGGALVAIGDHDGDGVIDTAIGCPGGDGGVVIASGADGTELLSIPAPQSGKRFGASLAALGDLNGDAVPDLAVSAPGDLSGSDPGQVFVYSGIDGTLLYTLTGAAGGDEFGAAIDAMGDIDGDGKAELVIGAPGSDLGGDDSGAASVHSGNDGTPLAVMPGADDDDHFGDTVAGDMQGTLKAEGEEPGVIIGSTQDDSGGNGYLRVYRGPDLDLDLTISGAPGERVGEAARLIADLDGDGTTDMALSVEAIDAAGEPAGPGVVRLVSGADGALMRELSSASAGPDFGYTLAAVGDVDGDGGADVAVGEPGAVVGEFESAGAVRVFSGNDGALLQRVSGGLAGANLGAALAPLGDIDGDLVADLGVGIPGALAGMLRAGTALFVSVAPWEPIAQTGVPNEGCVPELDGHGPISAHNDMKLKLCDAQPGSEVLLVIGGALVFDPQSGTFMPLPDILVGDLWTNGAGSLNYTFELPESMPAGTEIYYQFVLPDESGPSGVVRSNALLAETRG